MVNETPRDIFSPDKAIGGPHKIINFNFGRLVNYWFFKYGPI